MSEGKFVVYMPKWLEQRLDRFIYEKRMAGVGSFPILTDRGHHRQRRLSKSSFVTMCVWKMLDKLEGRQVVDGEDVANILKGEDET